MKVENYKNELERLERHMYPVRIPRRDSQSGIHEGEVEVGQQSEYLEKIFDTLKEATGTYTFKNYSLVRTSLKI